MRGSCVPRGWPLSLLCTALLLTTIPIALASAVPKTKGWVELQTGNFTIYSATSPGRTKKIAVELVRFQQVLAQITAGFDFSTDEPIWIFVFKNEVQMTPYKLDDSGAPRSIVGYFMDRPFRDYVAIDASSESRPMRVVYHEYVHSLLHKTFDSLPLWLDEGLAEYYSTFRFMTTSDSAQIGHPIDEHLYYLDSYGMLPLQDLFATTTKSRIYNEGERQGAFYAQSWLLVHYFASTEERRQRFGKFLTLIREDADPDEALTAAFGVSHEQLLQQLKEYNRTGSNFYWLDFKEATETIAVETHEMTPGDLLYRLGSLLTMRGESDAPAAVAHLNAALEQGGPEARIRSMLGLALQDTGDLAKAEEQFRKSVEFEDADAEVHARYGEFLLDRYVSKNSMLDIRQATPQPILDARRQFRASLERDPNEVEALVGLGQTYLFGKENNAEGLRALAAANAMRPDRVDILHGMACMLANSGRSTAAWSVIKTQLAPRARDEDTVRSAESWVLATEIDAAQERMQADDPAGAIEILELAATRVSDPEVRQRLERALREFEAPPGAPSGAASTGSEDDRRLVEQFNAAIDLANKGQHEQALQQLEQTLENCGESELCGPIRKNVDDLRALLKRQRLIARYNEAIDLLNAGRRKPAVKILRELELASDEQVRQMARSALTDLGVR